MSVRRPGIVVAGVLAAGVLAGVSADVARSAATDGPTAASRGPLDTALVGAGSPSTDRDRSPPTSLSDYAEPRDPGLTARSPTEEHRPRPPTPRRVELAFTGDMLLHDDVTAVGLAGPPPAGGGTGFDAMLAPVAAVLQRADLALCHLEVPLSPDGSDLSGYPVFNAPPELAGAIARAGYDGCSTASNHSLDRGPGGVAGTLGVLDAAGLGHAGMARSSAEDLAPRLYDVDGVTVGHVSATYGLNGFRMPQDQPWLVDLTEPVADVVREADLAREAGADIVVVSMHWGAEYQTEPTTRQRELAAVLLASPSVDVVVGHHAHVVQPVEVVDGKAVLYGLGNFLSGQSGRFDPGTQDGVVAAVTVEVDPAGARVVAVAVTPTWVEPRTYRVLPVEATLAREDLPPPRRLALDDSLTRTTTRMGEAATRRP